MALRWIGLTTPDAVLAATAEQRGAIRHCYAEIRQLVMDGHPDVMRALFWQREPLEWGCAILGEGESPARLLSVARISGTLTLETLVNHRFRVDDPDGERAAWRLLVEALNQAENRSGPT
jgi:hypothetical protein